jgi:choline dehydrogenase-like flavoprotein
VGRRTFLHPTVPIVGFFREPVEAFYGPPQSVAVHKRADRGPQVGYFIETAPVHPMLAAIAFPGYGDAHRKIAMRLPHVQATIALLIDGQHDDAGGRVSVSDAGRVKLSYPLGPELREAGVDALETMARILLAAGAEEVLSLHLDPVVVRSERDLPRLRAAPFGPNQHTLFSAHQMGGCPMGEDPSAAVVNSRGRHHQVQNLWVVDGSVFPTGLGVNPQVSVYGHARLFATELIRGG